MFQFFLDIVLEQQRKGTDIGEFLAFWELQKDRLSIVATRKFKRCANYDDS